MRSKRWFALFPLLLAALIIAVALRSVAAASNAKATAIAASPIQGTGALSGKVDASKDFKGAQVYARNVDKNVVYMVYTTAGRYKAIGLLPGNYEVTVKKSGFASDMK